MEPIRNITLLDQIYKNTDDSAVYIRNANKSYRGARDKLILKGFNMTVERGNIYGLLGASGCGKTTLLNCIVGRNLLNSGELWVLGGTPGTADSGVPGPRVGYMPQETALVQELTVLETIKFFGRLCSMEEDDKIMMRFKELSTLLDLPPAGQLINTLSGGQQRRVSLAAALVHNPELLILDEPTVGLDPLLRQRIWEHLITLTSNHKTTVIITTHYIEECRQAHRVGLMRQGKLLADGNPEDIIAQYGTDSLEAVFLKLSREQNDENDVIKNENSMTSTNQSTENIIPQSNSNSTFSLDGVEVEKNQEDSIKDHKKHKKRTRQAKLFRAFTIEHERVKSLFLKNLIQLFRNKMGIGMIFLFPIFQTSLFFITIGGDPRELPLAIVNDEEINCLDKNFTSYMIPNNETDCDYRFLSCKFIDSLNDDPLIQRVDYEDIESAIYSVKKGKTHGVLYFPDKYTDSLKSLIFGNIMKGNNTFDLGQLQVWLDMSNLQFGPRIKFKLIEQFVELQKSLLEGCNYSIHAGEIPVKMEDPIFGSKDGGYLVFCIPGCLVTLSFFLMTIATSSVIVEERTEGVWDRILVAGATTAEVLLNHLLTQFAIALITTTEILTLTFAVFKFTYAGSILNLAGILLCQCLCGMSFGFMISSIAKNYTAINSLSGGIFLPMTLVSGVMWPLEAMPVAVKNIAFALPFAFSVEAFRSVSMKGWSFTNPAVYTGYLLPIIWSFIYILLTFYFLKRKM